jgi:hypothetical protein
MEQRMQTIAASEELSKEHSAQLSKGRRTYDWDNPDNPIKGTGLSLRDIYATLQNGVTMNYVAQLIGVDGSTIRRWITKAGFDYPPEQRVGGCPPMLIKDAFKAEYNIDIDEIYNDFSHGMKSTELQRKYKIDRTVIKQWFAKLGYKTDRVEAVLAHNGITMSDLYHDWTHGKISKKAICTRYGFSQHKLNRAFESFTVDPHFNHTIVSIESAHREDVYDLEVPLTNNFALDAGVFVHNSHYTAALRLLSKYKGPGSKSSIRACIMRRGKKLGCPGASEKKNKDSIGEQHMSMTLDRALLNSNVNYVALSEYLPEDKRLTATQLNELKDSDFVGSNRTFPANDATHVAASKQLLSSLLETADSDDDKRVIKYMMDSLEARVSEFNEMEAVQDAKRETMIKNLEEKVARTEASLQDSEEANKKLTENLRALSVDALVTLKKFKGELEDEETFRKDIEDKELSDITALIDEVKSKHEGTPPAQDAAGDTPPEGDIDPVANPAAVDAENAQQTPIKRKVGLDNELKALAAKHGSAYAQRVLDNYIAKGTVVKDYTLPENI